jgi:hypothetical protein
LAPTAAWFVFHFNLKTYPWPEVIAKSDWTNAAFGENVPAEPPDSFHASSWSEAPLSLTNMPRSWLKPAVAVHRSAFAVSKIDWFAVAAQARRRYRVSTSHQLTPSLFWREYWRFEEAIALAIALLAVGQGVMTCWTSVALEAA